MTIVAVFVSGCSEPKTVSEDDFVRSVVDIDPPVEPLSPEESMKKIQLPPGYRIELVASEPMVQEPVAIAWDGNGRMFVAEMNTYMIDARGTDQFEPTSRIKLLEDIDGDGIIQESEWTGPDSYLGKVIAEKGLDKNKGMGRIYRIVHDDFKRDETKPNMLNEPAKKLITYLDHPNGWWRDNAQKQLIVLNDHSVISDLKEIAREEKQA